MKLDKPLESIRENPGPGLQREFYPVKDDFEIQIMNLLFNKLVQMCFKFRIFQIVGR